MTSTIAGNRLASAVAQVERKIAALDAEKIALLDDNCAVAFDEHFAYQECQAHAHADGTLSTDEAQVIYVALGEVYGPSNGGWAADTSTATKVVVTQIIGELLARRIARRVAS